MKKRIFGYDLVRAIAILLVMLGHSLGFIYAGDYSFFISFLSGFFGVELFFILSGVLIGKLLINAFNSENFQKRLQSFIVRRWLRTLPLYFLMLLVYYLGNRFFDPIKNDDVDFWKYLVFLQNFYEVQPTFFGVSWSLSIEEWFYVLFPVCLFIIKKGTPKISTKNLFVVGIAFFVFYFLLMRLLNLSEGQFHFYEGVRKIAFLRLDAIAFGILASWVMVYFQNKLFKFKNVLFLFGISILILNQYLIFKDQYQNLNYFNSFYFSFLGFGLCLLFPYFRKLQSPSKPILQTITYISKVSYSLYLVHWIVFKVLEMNFFEFIPDVLKFPIFFIISFATASILYYYFEKPILNYRDRITTR